MRIRPTVVLSVFAAMLSTALPASADIAFAIAPPFFLVRFDTARPNVLTHATVITGLAIGERIEAIDYRPRTGQLFALGVVHGVTDTVRTYTIDPFSGAAKQVGSSTLSVTSGTGYGLDFNPTVDRIRVTNDGDENLRLNPNNGTRADSPTNDTDINPGALQITGVAYDRSYDTGLAVANRSTLYGISLTANSLVTIGGINQTPSPNGGAVTTVGPLGLTLTAGSEIGFDIAAGSNVAHAALRAGGTGLTGLYTINLATGAATMIGTIGNGAFDVTGLAIVPRNTLVVGAGPGGGPHIRVFDAQSGAVAFEGFAYTSAFTGGVRVATGDVNLDGIPDVITGAGPGGAPHLQVFNGINGALLPGFSFFAYAPAFSGGMFVAAGDVNADGNKDIITGADAGGAPHVRVISGANASVLAEFFAYSGNFTGGVRVAAADFDLDGDYEIVTGAGPGGAPHVKVLDGNGNLFGGTPANNFFAYAGDFSGGVYVAAGDVNGDGVPDIITGAGAGGGPHVRAISGATGAVITEFFAYEWFFTGGVQVAVADLNGDGRYEIVTGSGPGRPAEIRVFDGVTGALQQAFQPYGGFTGGAFVGGVRR